MTGTPLEGRVAGLFRGIIKSYGRCTSVEFESSKIEDFYDLSMLVKDVPDIAT